MKQLTLESAACPAEKDPMEKILSLAPSAVDEIERILTSPKSSPGAQVQVIDIILNRAYGKPEGIIRMQAEGRPAGEAAGRIRAVAENIRRKRGMDHE